MILTRLRRIYFFDSPMIFWLFLFLFFAAGLVLVFVANGTCDNGDSTMHYQFARFAPWHPVLFFDHWAKPLYVLLACPASQFGIPGIKIFNLTLSTGTIFITWKVARIFQIKRSALVGVFMAFSPALLIYSLSGLTEPMFAFVLILCIYLYLSNVIASSVLVISFLPFVRSEGLMICGIFGVLLLLEKRFWLIPLLGVGHIVYGLVGVIFQAHNSVLWVFTAIPYAKFGSAYGKGPWGYFIFNLPAFTGWPLSILLGVGVMVGVVNALKFLRTQQGLREIILVYGCFLTYFLGHTSFWALGIFNSFGLMRVLIGVLPLMTLIEIRGLNIIDVITTGTFKQIIAFGAVASVVVFPFTKYNGAWKYKAQFCLGSEAVLQEEAVTYVKANHPDWKDYKYYFDNNYAAIALDMDYFDSTKVFRTYQIWAKPSPKSIVIWDDWYSAFEYRFPLESLKGNPNVKFVKEFEVKDPEGTVRVVNLFEAVN